MLPALLAACLLAAPDGEASEAEKKLRVAWASQYEWKEHGVENAIVEFTYTASWKGRDGAAGKWEGRGHFVVVGAEIVRGHFPGADEKLRGQLDEHVAWIAARFARKPFEEEFKDASFEGPTELIGGTGLKIGAGKRTFLLRDDKLIGEERDVGTKQRPFIMRVDYTTAALGDGYGVLRSQAGYTRNSAKVSWSRKLATANENDIPVPRQYEYRYSTPGDTRALSLEVTGVRTNHEHPIVLEPEAQSILEEAWGRRFVLPRGIRIEAEFQRKIDRELDKVGWANTVKGELLVWGIEDIQAKVDERTFRNDAWRARVEETCVGHMRQFFEPLRDTPFAEEFQGCGFRRDPDDAAIVHVDGYTKALAFRIDDGRIEGRLDNDFAGDTWWSYKLKSLKDVFMITRMSRKVEKETYTLKVSYARSRKIMVPRKFEVLVTPATNETGDVYGIVEYTLKKLSAKLP